jgi:hypothetical protein
MHMGINACTACLTACWWPAAAIIGTFDVRLNVVEVPEDKTIVFTLAESTFMRNFDGRWQVGHAGTLCSGVLLGLQTGCQTADTPYSLQYTVFHICMSAQTSAAACCLKPYGQQPAVSRWCNPGSVQPNTDTRRAYISGFAV